MAAALLIGAAAVETGASASLSKPPTQATIRRNAAYLEAPFDYGDDRDAEWAGRGLIPGSDRDAPRILKDDGTVIWDIGRFAFVSGDIREPQSFPPTVNPSLWRNAILNNKHGLFEVVRREIGGESRSIYQVRGYDVANMSFVETQNGFIAVDILSYKESAAAAVKLFYDHIPASKREKKIHTIIITHSHGDHFGGIDGVLESGMAEASPAIVVPQGFVEAADSENNLVGPAMLTRANSMYGHLLWKYDIPERHGKVSNGLAIDSATNGTARLPGRDPARGDQMQFIKEDGETHYYDGTRVDFIMAQNTEAPAQMVFFFPEYNSICLAEICNQTQHNVLTPRGAQVRDTKAWYEALDKMLAWVDEDDGSELSAWGPHTWPRWGSAEIAEYIEGQRDLYRDLHDETVRLMNEGYDMKEVAERFVTSPDVAREWFNRGYYGATVHNVKAVYQKYLGWFDNNPATLWKLPDKDSAALYARYARGGGDLTQAALAAYNDGHYRWVADVLEYIRLAPGAWGASVHKAALEIQADAFEQLAYSTESAIWRNYFLTGTWRNRLFNGSDDEMHDAFKAGNIPAVSPGMSKDPTGFTKDANAKYIQDLPFKTDTRDAAWADRGFIARVASGDTEPLRITKDDGTVVWDMARYSYISGDISAPEQFPDTVNPSLWRNAILNNKYGLYE
ncbi:MAG: MBL fold metallo-hydrolase, partial [Synergistaceae bacterium]|nr:MBL fold metallo-hydrolase [Synergistaceae bacterium]